MMTGLSKLASYYFYPPLDLTSADAICQIKKKPAGYYALSVKRNCRSGFYMLECRFSERIPGNMIQFSMSNDSDFTAANLPFQINHLNKDISYLNKRIVYMPFHVEGWQLSILDASYNYISLSEQDCKYLRLVPLRKSFAVDRMLKRLRLNKPTVKLVAQKRSQSFSKVLYGMYDQSFEQSSDKNYQYWIDWVEVEQITHAYHKTTLEQSESTFHFYCALGYSVVDNAEEIMQLALIENPQALIVYGDEDRLNAFGFREKPYFKPNWNPDLFLADDYISSAYACRKSWYDRHEKIFERFGTRAALTYLLPKLNAKQILHIPQILSHRQDKAEDDNAQSKRKAALLELAAENSFSVFDGLLGKSHRIVHSMPEPAPLVSLLIPTRDGLEILKPCVESIFEKTTYTNYEILILDNQSTKPETLQWFDSIAQHEKVSVLNYDHPFNYSAINNFGARQAQGSIIGLINNDVEVISPDWLTEMVSHACRPDIGCVGAKLYYSNGQIQHAGVILGLGDVAGHAHRFCEGDADGYQGRLKLVQNYSAVTGACLLVSKDIYEQVGGLEEEHLTVAYNDVDFCLRVRALGYRNLWTPYAELYHHESISRGDDDTPEKRARYEKEVAYMKATWGEELENDPCYNPNLSRRREDFSLREFLP